MTTQADSVDLETHEEAVREADALQTEIYRRMSPSQRLAVGVAMQQQARELMDAGLRLTQPHLSVEEREREVARRILHART